MARPVAATPFWQMPPGRMALPGQQLHLWRASIDVDEAGLDSLWQTISLEEQRRAQRYRRELDGNRFVASHGILRRILSRYTRFGPPFIRFQVGHYGKPELTPDSGGNLLRFNLSHSGGIAIYAITGGKQVGVDVERVNPELPFMEIAERFFAAGEVARLKEAPEEERAELFYRLWTDKEAYAKAIGKGLADGLEGLEIGSLPNVGIVEEPAVPTRNGSGEQPAQEEQGEDPGDAPSEREDEGPPPDKKLWSLQRIRPAEGFVCAVVIEGHYPALQFWEAPKG